MTNHPALRQNPDIEALLKRISIFTDLPADALQSITGQLKKRKLPKNSYLFMEGDESDSLFIVESGIVKVFAGNREGKNVTLDFIGEGGYFGELALLDDLPRSASVITLTKATFYTLSRQAFRLLMAERPSINLCVIQALSLKVRGLTENVKDHALLDVYGRIIKVLKNQDNYQTVGRLTHQEIANIVGSSREMVSRIIKELCMGEYIEQLPESFAVKKKLPDHW